MDQSEGNSFRSSSRPSGRPPRSARRRNPDENRLLRKTSHSEPPLGIQGLVDRKDCMFDQDEMSLSSRRRNHSGRELSSHSYKGSFRQHGNSEGDIEEMKILNAATGPGPDIHAWSELLERITGRKIPISGRQTRESGESYHLRDFAGPETEEIPPPATSRVSARPIDPKDRLAALQELCNTLSFTEDLSLRRCDVANFCSALARLLGWTAGPVVAASPPAAAAAAAGGASQHQPGAEPSGSPRQQTARMQKTSSVQRLKGVFSSPPREDFVVEPVGTRYDPQIALYACRALTLLMQGTPLAGEEAVQSGCVAILCQQLQKVEFIDLAEQALQAVETLSRTHPDKLIQGGALKAVLAHIDFLPLPQQRVAINAAGSMCWCLGDNDSARAQAREAFDPLNSLLTMLVGLDDEGDPVMAHGLLICYLGLLQIPPETVGPLKRQQQASWAHEVLTTSVLEALLGKLGRAISSFSNNASKDGNGAPQRSQIDLSAESTGSLRRPSHVRRLSLGSQLGREATPLAVVMAILNLAARSSTLLLEEILQSDICQLLGSLLRLNLPQSRSSHPNSSYVNLPSLVFHQLLALLDSVIPPLQAFKRLVPLAQGTVEDLRYKDLSLPQEVLYMGNMSSRSHAVRFLMRREDNTRLHIRIHVPPTGVAPGLDVNKLYSGTKDSDVNMQQMRFLLKPLVMQLAQGSMEAGIDFCALIINFTTRLIGQAQPSIVAQLVSPGLLASNLARCLSARKDGVVDSQVQLQGIILMDTILRRLGQPFRCALFRCGLAETSWVLAALQGRVTLGAQQRRNNVVHNSGDYSARGWSRQESSEVPIFMNQNTVGAHNQSNWGDSMTPQMKPPPSISIFNTKRTPDHDTQKAFIASMAAQVLVEEHFLQTAGAKRNPKAQLATFNPEREFLLMGQDPAYLGAHNQIARLSRLADHLRDFQSSRIYDDLTRFTLNNRTTSTQALQNLADTLLSEEGMTPHELAKSGLVQGLTEFLYGEGDPIQVAPRARSLLLILACKPYSDDVQHKKGPNSRRCPLAVLVDLLQALLSELSNMELRQFKVNPPRSFLNRQRNNNSRSNILRALSSGSSAKNKSFHGGLITDDVDGYISHKRNSGAGSIAEVGWENGSWCRPLLTPLRVNLRMEDQLAKSGTSGEIRQSSSPFHAPPVTLLVEPLVTLGTLRRYIKARVLSVKKDQTVTTPKFLSTISKFGSSKTGSGAWLSYKSGAGSHRTGFFSQSANTKRTFASLGRLVDTKNDLEPSVLCERSRESSRGRPAARDGERSSSSDGDVPSSCCSRLSLKLFSSNSPEFRRRMPSRSGSSRRRKPARRRVLCDKDPSAPKTPSVRMNSEDSRRVTYQNGRRKRMESGSDECKSPSLSSSWRSNRELFIHENEQQNKRELSKEHRTFNSSQYGDHLTQQDKQKLLRNLNPFQIQINMGDVSLNNFGQDTSLLQCILHYKEAKGTNGIIDAQSQGNESKSLWADTYCLSFSCGQDSMVMGEVKNKKSPLMKTWGKDSWELILRNNSVGLAAFHDEDAMRLCEEITGVLDLTLGGGKRGKLQVDGLLRLVRVLHLIHRQGWLLLQPCERSQLLHSANHYRKGRGSNIAEPMNFARFEDEVGPTLVRADGFLNPKAFHNPIIQHSFTVQLGDCLTVAGGVLPSWMEDTINNSPFLLPSSVRRRFFQCTAFGPLDGLLALQEWAEKGHLGLGSVGERRIEKPRTKVKVAREQILKYAVSIFERHASSTTVLEFEFKGECGSGIGPTLEFYTLVCQALQRKGLGLWVQETIEADPEGEPAGVASARATLEWNEKLCKSMEDTLDNSHTSISLLSNAKTPRKMSEKEILFGEDKRTKDEEKEECFQSDNEEEKPTLIHEIFNPQTIANEKLAAPIKDQEKHFNIGSQSCGSLTGSVDTLLLERAPKKLPRIEKFPVTEPRLGFVEQEKSDDVHTHISQLKSDKSPGDCVGSTLNTAKLMPISKPPLPDSGRLRRTSSGLSLSSWEKARMPTSARRQDLYISCPYGIFPAPLPLDDSPMKRARAQQAARIFRFFGTLIAKALVDKRLLALPLSWPLLKLIRGERLTAWDLWEVDPSLAQQLDKLTQLALRAQQVDRDPYLSPKEKNVLKQSVKLDGATVADLCLTFVLPGFPDIELYPGGADLNVTINNLSDYIKRVACVYLESGIKVQVHALLDGFNQIFNHAFLRPFSLRELEVMVCGEPEEWTIEYLQEVTVCDHGYDMESETITHLFEVLSEFDADWRRLFVQFLTGAPQLSVGGMQKLKPSFTVVRKDPEQGSNLTPDMYLPSVMTCAHYLKLPKYSSKEILQERLRKAILEGQSAFHLS